MVISIYVNTKVTNNGVFNLITTSLNTNINFGIHLTVTDMNQLMFFNATDFNQNITSWDTV